MSAENIKKALEKTFSHHVKLVQANRSSKLLIDFLYERLNASSSNGYTSFSALKDNSITLEGMLNNLKTVIENTYDKANDMTNDIKQIIDKIDNTIKSGNENEQFELLKRGFDELNKIENDKILNNEFKMKIQSKFDEIRSYMLNGDPSEDFAEL